MEESPLTVNLDYDKLPQDIKALVNPCIIINVYEEGLQSKVIGSKLNLECIEKNEVAQYLGKVVFVDENAE